MSQGYARLHRFLRNAYPDRSYDEGAIEVFCRVFDLGVSEGIRKERGESVSIREEEDLDSPGYAHSDYNLFE